MMSIYFFSYQPLSTSFASIPVTISAHTLSASSPGSTTTVSYAGSRPGTLRSTYTMNVRCASLTSPTAIFVFLVFLVILNPYLGNRILQAQGSQPTKVGCVRAHRVQTRTTPPITRRSHPIPKSAIIPKRSAFSAHGQIFVEERDHMHDNERFGHRKGHEMGTRNLHALSRHLFERVGRLHHVVVTGGASLSARRCLPIEASPHGAAQTANAAHRCALFEPAKEREHMNWPEAIL